MVTCNRGLSVEREASWNNTASGTGRQFTAWNHIVPKFIDVSFINIVLGINIDWPYRIIDVIWFQFFPDLELSDYRETVNETKVWTTQQL